MFEVRSNEDIDGVRFIKLSGKPTDRDLDAYFRYEEELTRARPPSDRVIVIHLTEVWTSSQRKQMRDFELKHEQNSPSTALGMAMVVPNAFIRGAFTAYFWLAPPSYPTVTVAKAEDAFPFVEECLETAGLPRPNQSEFERVCRSPWKVVVAGEAHDASPLAS